MLGCGGRCRIVSGEVLGLCRNVRGGAEAV